MANIVPISNSRHAGKAWRRPANFAFAAAQSVAPLVGPEFGRVALSMPIAFIEQAGQYRPVAVMSPLSGRNLFIGPAGQWLGEYVPAGLRSYPFRLGRLDGGEEVALCIDEESGLVVDAEEGAEAFFDAEGTLSAASKAMLDFLAAMEHARMSTDLAVTALAEAGLIEPWPLQVKTGTDSTQPVRGLYRINEAALNALDDAAFLKLRKTAGLPLAYSQLLSVGQMGIFERLSLTQQQLAQAHQQPQPPKISSLDEIFERARSQTLRFN
jgi:hypothetical protein